jgi:fructokinase
MNVYSERLVRALASVINIVDPEVIVLGGGLSKMDALYRLIPEKLAAHVFSPIVHTRVLPPAHGDSSGVRGAAWLWPERASADEQPG